MVKNSQKKEIRKISNKAGLSFLLLVLIYMVFMWIFLKINENYFNINTDAVKIVVTLISFIFPYFIMVKSMKKKISDVVSINLPKKRLFSYITVGLLVAYISNLITMIVVDFLKNHNIVSKTPESLFEYENTPIGIILFFISLSVVPAISEEFIFRGVILGLLRKFGNGFAIVASAFMFSLMHGNIEQIIAAFLLGLYLGFCVVKTNSIIPAVLIHFFNNFNSTLIFFLEDIDHPYYFFVLVIDVIIFILAILFLRNIYKDFKKNHYKTKKTQLNLSFGSKMSSFILTPGMILFLGYVAVSLYFSLQ